MKTLRTATEVIDALGGTNAVAALTGRKKSSVSNWRKRNRFPFDTFEVLEPALRTNKLRAPKSLWGIPKGITVTVAKSTSTEGVDQ